MKYNLSELANRLQDLCSEGLSELRITVDGKEEIEIQYDPQHQAINIKKAHK